VAKEHLNDLLRAANVARAVALIPDRHHTPRQRPAWWISVTAFGRTTVPTA
jgi:hypothetical protein